MFSSYSSGLSWEVLVCFSAFLLTSCTPVILGERPSEKRAREARKNDSTPTPTPTTPSVAIASPVSMNIINISTDLISYAVSGTCSENGRTVTVSVTDGSNSIAPASQPVCSTGSTPNWTTTVNLTTLSDSSITFKANHSDSAGNAASEASVSVLKDTIVPTTPSGLAHKTPASSPGLSATPVFTVSGVTVGNTVSIYASDTSNTSDRCALSNLKGSAVVASGSTVDVTSSTLSNGVLYFDADSTDAAGNRSGCTSVSASYEKVSSPASLSITSHPSGSYDFGNVFVGGTGSVTLTLTNGGGATAQNILVPSSLDRLYRDSSVPSNCGTSLTAGASCAIKLDYIPDQNVVLLATLNVSYENGVGGSGSFDFSFAGQGQNPALLAFNKTSHDFGKVLIGGSNHQPGDGGTEVTLTNLGDVSAALTNTDTFSSTEFSYYDSFTFPGTGGTCTTTLGAGQSCTIVLAATPNGEVGPALREGQYSEGFGYEYTTGTGNASVSVNLSFFAVKLLLARPTVDSAWVLSTTYSSPDFASRQYIPLFVHNPSDYPTQMSFSGIIPPQFRYTGRTYPGDGRLGRPAGVSLCPAAGAMLPAGATCSIEFEYDSSLSTSTSVNTLRASVSPVNSQRAPELEVLGGLGDIRVSIMNETWMGASCTCSPAHSASYGGGSGTSSDPYRVCSTAHLEQMASLGNNRFPGQYFQQCSDIDFASSPDHAPLNISGTSGFEGFYNGMGRVIKNLGGTIGGYTPGLCDEGMIFSSINASGAVRNLGVQNASAVFGGGEDRSSCGFGILAGKNAGTLQNVWTSGTVKISTSFIPVVVSPSGYGGAVVGGVVGVQTGTIELQNLWSTASVELYGKVCAYPAFLGGLVGWGETSISDSFFAGTISRNLWETCQFSSRTTAGGIVGKGSVSGSNLFNIGTIKGGNHDRDSLTGIAEILLQGASISNFGPLTSRNGASYGVAASIGDDSGGAISVSNLRNYGAVSGVGAYGIVGAIEPNAQVSQVYSFGDLSAHTGVAASNPSVILSGGAYGFAGMISGSAEKVGVINRIFLDEAVPADRDCMFNSCPPQPDYSVTANGLAGQVSGGGSLSKSFYIGEATLSNLNGVPAFGIARFFGIASMNLGSVDQVYSILLKPEGLSSLTQLGGQEACIGQGGSSATHIYTWVDSALLAGRSQDSSPITTGCTPLTSQQMLSGEGFQGFDFISIHGALQPATLGVTPVWTIPGTYWPTPGF
jgi:hypothetical protein